MGFSGQRQRYKDEKGWVFKGVKEKGLVSTLIKKKKNAGSVEPPMHNTTAQEGRRGSLTEAKS